MTVTMIPTPSPTATWIAPSVTSTPILDLVRQIQAVPNLSQDREPIRFEINLDSPAKILLNLYTVAGEGVYSTVIEGAPGEDSCVWLLKNSGNLPVASGIYIYAVRVEGPAGTATRVGKVLVLH